MTDRRYPVWFERPIPPAARSEVLGRAVVLGPPTATDAHKDLEGAYAVIAGASVYDSAFIDAAPSLRVIARTGIGVDGVDVTAATKRGIAVCNAPDAPTTSTAEHTIALLLAIAKNLTRATNELRAGASNLYAGHRAIELDGKTLGLVGYGRIARRVANFASAMGMRVITYDPYVAPTDLGTVSPVDTLDDLLGVADVVSLHVPLVPENRSLVGAVEFAAMKDGAIFINTARGGLVDHDALLDAVDSGKLFGAGLDVTEPEPLEQSHPLLHRENVVVTPHIATATDEGKLRLLLTAFGQAIQVLDGVRPRHLVNPEVWNREESIA